jgi:hypothetical protein
MALRDLGGMRQLGRQNMALSGDVLHPLKASVFRHMNPPLDSVDVRKPTVVSPNFKPLFELLTELLVTVKLHTPSEGFLSQRR